MKLSRTHLAIARILRADISAPMRTLSTDPRVDDRARESTALARYLVQYFALDAQLRADFAEACGLSALAHEVVDAANTAPTPAPAPAATRSIETIAREIRRIWINPYFGARPYLEAMLYLTDRKSVFGADSATSVVAYFLSNARAWRGPDAKRIKAELKLIAGIK